MTLNTSLVVCC